MFKFIIKYTCIICLITKEFNDKMLKVMPIVGIVNLQTSKCLLLFNKFKICEWI